MTLTAATPNLLRQFEPYAPLYSEQLQVIIELIRHGFYTNVMMEPYLSDPIEMIEEVTPILSQQTRSDWVIPIGKMNYTASMQLNPDPVIDQQMKTYLEQLYSRENLLRLWSYVENNPHLFFKKD